MVLLRTLEGAKYANNASTEGAKYANNNTDLLMVLMVLLHPLGIAINNTDLLSSPKGGVEFELVCFQSPSQAHIGKI